MTTSKKKIVKRLKVTIPRESFVQGQTEMIKKIIEKSRHLTKIDLFHAVVSAENIPQSKDSASKGAVVVSIIEGVVGNKVEFSFSVSQ